FSAGKPVVALAVAICEDLTSPARDELTAGEVAAHLLRGESHECLRQATLVEAGADASHG
ncbi:MAG TPA: hypothetical protein VNF72_07595, partial [Myxococcota bacterium]|nr:hypothetical protein [Myxococcota bacterium]